LFSIFGLLQLFKNSDIKKIKHPTHGQKLSADFLSIFTGS